MSRRAATVLGCLPILLLVLGSVSAAPVGAAADPGMAAPASAVCTQGSGLTLTVQQPNATAPSTVSFAVADARGPPDWVNWSFGDGLTANHTNSTYLTITHLYATLGTYAVEVVIGQSPNLLSCSTSVAVQAAPFSVAIRAEPTSGVAPVTVRFTAILRGGTGTYQSALWSFGNGQGATGFNVSFTYDDPGQFVASIDVLDSGGQVALANATIVVSAAANNGTGTPGGSGGPPVWLELVAVAIAGAAVLGVAYWWILGPGRRPKPSGDDASEPAAVDGGPSAPEPVPDSPSPSGAAAGAPDLSTLGPPSIAPEPEIVPSELPVPAPSPDLLASAAPGGAAVAAPTPEEAAPSPSGPRLKLSQRVMLHLYRQGHLADGEVAPVGFTQAGMSEALEVAQSPLSSVLRRLVVAGLVVQDTRHVRGQPRRLRVYRLSPIGESVARDLYHHPPPTGGSAEEP